MSDAAADPAAGRRRGRRPGGKGTRETLLAAALDVFAEQGFDGATVRTIAGRAGVDPAMVNHWFGGKQGLFMATINAPFDPTPIIERILTGDVHSIGERVIRTFVTVWDAHSGRFAAIMHSVASQDAASQVLREFLINAVIGQITKAIGVADGEFRATLCASQIIGLGVSRYVLNLEPLASAEVESVVAAVGPTLQRYLTGDIETEPAERR